MVLWKGWREEEEAALRDAYERVDARVTAFDFWNDVHFIFSARFPHRTRTAVQQHGLIMGLGSKRIDTHDIICIGCDKVGVHNRKRGLCLRCYGRVRY